ncbi:MAG: hypothetical protein AB1Z98_26740, partial [Nannocystaceae bacterium]
VDLDSTNGTLVDRVRVLRLELRVGTHFEIMGTRMVYTSMSAENRNEDAEAPAHQFSSLRPTNDYVELFQSDAANMVSRTVPPPPGNEDITAVRHRAFLARLDLRTQGTPHDVTESGTTYRYARGAEHDPPSSS